MRLHSPTFGLVIVILGLGCLLAANETKPKSPVSSVNIQDFGAIPDDRTDDTAAIQKAIDSLKHGGDVVLPAGRYLISATLKVPSATVLHGQGRPSQTAAKRADWPGTWLETLPGFDGPLVLLDSVKDVTIERVGFDGGDRGPTSKSVGLSIQSNSTKDPALATANIDVSSCTFSCIGTGIVWGRGNWEEQSDHVRIEHCAFEVAGVGISINSGNAADYSCVNNCRFNVYGTAFDLKVCGFLAIRDCAGGGVGATFIHRDAGENLLIENSQCEGMKAFLIVDGANDSNAVNLVSNQIDCPVVLNTICRVVATGNSYNAKVEINHPGAQYLGIADWQSGQPYGVNYVGGSSARSATLDLGGGRRIGPVRPGGAQGSQRNVGSPRRKTGTGSMRN